MLYLNSPPPSSDQAQTLNEDYMFYLPQPNHFISFHLFNINYKNSNMAFHGTCQPLNNSGVANRGHDLA